MGGLKLGATIATAAFAIAGWALWGFNSELASTLQNSHVAYLAEVDFGIAIIATILAIIFVVLIIRDGIE